MKTNPCKKFKAQSELGIPKEVIEDVKKAQNHGKYGDKDRPKNHSQVFNARELPDTSLSSTVGGETRLVTSAKEDKPSVLCFGGHAEGTQNHARQGCGKEIIKNWKGEAGHFNKNDMWYFCPECSKQEGNQNHAEEERQKIMKEEDENRAEKTLSDMIIKSVDIDILDTKDVKEAIRRLKDEIKVYGMTTRSRLNELIREELFEKIDKIFGEDLSK